MQVRWCEEGFEEYEKFRLGITTRMLCQTSAGSPGIRSGQTFSMSSWLLTVHSPCYFLPVPQPQQKSIRVLL